VHTGAASWAAGELCGAGGEMLGETVYEEVYD